MPQGEPRPGPKLTEMMGVSEFRDSKRLKETGDFGYLSFLTCQAEQNEMEEQVEQAWLSGCYHLLFLVFFNFLELIHLKC